MNNSMFEGLPKIMSVDEVEIYVLDTITLYETVYILGKEVNSETFRYYKYDHESNMALNLDSKQELIEVYECFINKIPGITEQEKEEMRSVISETEGEAA